MLKSNINRAWACVAIGGGVVGDLAGFAASIIMRGIPFIQIPTTLLAQVDASIGGKTCINHNFGKNLIGSFYQPEFVLCDVEFFKTLKPEVLSSALAEVVKYGIIMDKPLFEYLEVTSQYDYKEIVKMCAKDKAYVVAADEKEGGLRRTLNFGHTLGHAIEKLYKFEILHGHAVAIGMMFASWLSRDLGLLKEKDMKRIEGLINHLQIIDPRITLPQPDALKDILILDKKAYKDGIQFVLTPGIGDVTVKKMEIADILDAYRRFFHGYKKSL
jgi:3-dehydroquinate synthase